MIIIIIKSLERSIRSKCLPLKFVNWKCWGLAKMRQMLKNHRKAKIF